MRLVSNLKIMQTTFLLVLFFGMLIAPSHAATIFKAKGVVSVPNHASQLTHTVDNSGLDHYVFVVGEENKTSVKYEGKYPNSTLYHIWGNSSSVDEFQNETIAENVLQYEYNFVFDSAGNLHIAYVGGDNVLYYTIKNANTGIWSTPEALTTPDPVPGNNDTIEPIPGIKPADPFIALNENDEPRIIHSTIYIDDLSTLKNTTRKLQGIQTIHYRAINETGNWEVFDMMNNSIRGEALSELRIIPSKPSMKIVSPTEVYFTWTNKYQLFTFSYLHFLKLDTDLPSQDTDFVALTHKSVDKLGTQTEFRRTNIIPYENSMLLMYGSETQGGPRISYLADLNLLDTTDDIETVEWTNYNLDEDREFRAVENMDVDIFDGKIYTTWSMFDKSAEFDFEYDVYFASVDLGNALTPNDWDYVRVTKSINIEHRFPRVSYKVDHAEVSFISETIIDGEITSNLEIKESLPSISGFTDPQLLFIGSLAIIGAMVYGFRKLVNKLPEPEVKEEILPHLYNLKDSIEKD